MTRAAWRMRASPRDPGVPPIGTMPDSQGFAIFRRIGFCERLEPRALDRAFEAVAKFAAEAARTTAGLAMLCVAIAYCWNTANPHAACTTTCSRIRAIRPPHYAMQSTVSRPGSCVARYRRCLEPVNDRSDAISWSSARYGCELVCIDTKSTSERQGNPAASRAGRRRLMRPQDGAPLPRRLRQAHPLPGTFRQARSELAANAPAPLACLVPPTRSVGFPRTACEHRHVLLALAIVAA